MGNITSKSSDTVKITSGTRDVLIHSSHANDPQMPPYGRRCFCRGIYVQEIKTNVKSDTANSIRYDIDPVEIHKRPQNVSVRIRGEEQTPSIDLIAALKKWKQAVENNAKWDHKQKIRAQFKAYAVHRPLRAKEQPQI